MSKEIRARHIALMTSALRILASGPAEYDRHPPWGIAAHMTIAFVGNEPGRQGLFNELRIRPTGNFLGDKLKPPAAVHKRVEQIVFRLKMPRRAGLFAQIGEQTRRLAGERFPCPVSGSGPKPMGLYSSL